MSQNCICKPAEMMVFSCSGGGANVGQLSNQAAFELTKEGKVKMYCLAGLGGHVPGIIEATKQAKKIVVVDGCPIACAKKMVEHVQIKIDHHILITELGIEKTPGAFDMTDEEVQLVKAEIQSALDA